MEIKRFVHSIKAALGADFYTGVPDSQLKALCDHLMETYGTDPRHHVIAANEGNAAALAAGYHLATSKTPVVYLQNSGLGNIVNPLASLLHQKVYGIPVLFIVGWRGEPGVHDEPQHLFQGEVTLQLLRDMEIEPFAVGADTSESELNAAMEAFRPRLAAGGQAALVVRKGALSFSGNTVYANRFPLKREEIIRAILRYAQEDLIVSTTGKTSRELFELREAAGQGHARDFLTVGSMGHASSIALGAALHCPSRRVWCIDGDGAAIMHMGALAVIGASRPDNLVHILINNGAHESVGGMPTVAAGMDWPAIARGCGYPYAASASEAAALEQVLDAVKQRGELSLIEVKCAIGARADLGRPTTSAQSNKQEFMAYLACQDRGTQKPPVK